MKTITFQIKGTAPLLQNDDKLANPFSDAAQRFKVLSAKRKKDEDDFREMSRIEWHAGLYHTPEKGYYIKAEKFMGAFNEAAKAIDQLKLFRKMVSVPDDPTLRFPDEHLSPEKLFKKEGYLSYLSVRVQRAKIYRSRPQFEEWGCDVTLNYEEEYYDEPRLREIVEYAGKFFGVGDYRPKYGRFEIVGIREEPEEEPEE